jgi:hypothetical protein
MERDNRKDKFRKALNVLLAIAVFGAWGRMVVSGEGTLASTGLSSLKYFTVLSNLLEGFACLYWLAGKGAQGERLKFVAAVAVSITFLVVMTFLGPLYGYPFMFEGANLWFHLLVPVGAILEQVFLSKGPFGRKDVLFAALPVLFYGVGYLCNILMNGVGEWPDTNDWYSFMMWGYPGAAVIYGGLILISLALGLLFRKVRVKK